jgi:hypothetical protein
VPVVRFDRERHGPVVFDAWTLGAGISRSQARRLVILGADVLVRIGPSPIVLHDKETDLVQAFLVYRGKGVVWAYTKPVYRKRGFLVELLTAAGIDPSEGVRMLTRSGPSDLIVKTLNKRGWRIQLGEEDERQED